MEPDEKETRTRRRQGMQVRQVVTGHDAEGRAVFVRDKQVDGMPIPHLGELAFLWSADEPATYPNAGDNPAAPGTFPPVGGIRFIMQTYSPEFDVVAPEPTPEMHIEDGDEPGFHRTDTTDFGVLISGNLAVELDDGAEVLLSPGDVLVENGTRHRFRVVDALITNFHLPRSTLLVLVAALAGRDLILDAYRHAVAARYRFYSSGDAMLIQ